MQENHITDGEQEQDTVSAQHYFHEMGFNVLPMSDKRPLIQWKAWQAITQAWQDVQAMPWDDNTTGLAGINGVNHLLSFDVDHATSRAAITILLIALGLPDTYAWIVQSGNGWHLWLRCAEAISIQGIVKNKFVGYPTHPPPSFDALELRVKVHYTVLPASLHHSGRQYQFERDEIPDAPPAYVTAQSVEKAFLAVAHLKDEKVKEIKNPHAHARAAIDEELATLKIATPGERNTALNTCAFKVEQVMKLDGLNGKDAAATRQAIKEIALSLGLEETETERTLESARTGAQVHPRTSASDGFVKRPSRFARVSLADLFSRPRPRYLLDGYLYEHESSLLLGESDVGKSFLVLDWSLHIALGIPWFGHATTKAKIVYVAGEGADGYARRIDAWLQYHGHTQALLEENFSFVDTSVQLLSDVDEFITQKKAEASDGAQLGLIVFDTLSRCTAGKDESNNGLMALAIAEAERARRELSAMHVLIIHHNSDKPGAPKTGRGASSLKGTVNAMMLLELDGDILTLSLTRSKDHEGGIQDRMRRIVVKTSLWDEQKGEYFTSCVMEQVTGLVLMKKPLPGRWAPKTPRQIVTYELLPIFPSFITFQDWRDLASEKLDEPGKGYSFPESTHKTIKNKLLDEKLISYDKTTGYSRRADGERFDGKDGKDGK